MSFHPKTRCRYVNFTLAPVYAVPLVDRLMADTALTQRLAHWCRISGQNSMVLKIFKAYASSMADKLTQCEDKAIELRRQLNSALVPFMMNTFDSNIIRLNG